MIYAYLFVEYSFKFTTKATIDYKFDYNRFDNELAFSHVGVYRFGVYVFRRLAVFSFMR